MFEPAKITIASFKWDERTRVLSISEEDFRIITGIDAAVGLPINIDVTGNTRMVPFTYKEVSDRKVIYKVSSIAPQKGDETLALWINL